MSAQELRDAAALMRKRAQVANVPAPSPWQSHAATNGDPTNGPTVMRVSDASRTPIADTEYDRFGGAMTEHIASWHPAVALAVADVLDLLSEMVDDYPNDLEPAVDLARIYLGSAS